MIPGRRPGDAALAVANKNPPRAQRWRCGSLAIPQKPCELGTRTVTSLVSSDSRSYTQGFFAARRYKFNKMDGTRRT